MPRPGLRGGSVAAAVCGRSDGGGRHTRGRPPLAHPPLLTARGLPCLPSSPPRRQRRARTPHRVRPRRPSRPPAARRVEEGGRQGRGGLGGHAGDRRPVRPPPGGRSAAPPPPRRAAPLAIAAAVAVPAGTVNPTTITAAAAAPVGAAAGGGSVGATAAGTVRPSGQSQAPFPPRSPPPPGSSLPSLPPASPPPCSPPTDASPRRVFAANGLGRQRCATAPRWAGCAVPFATGGVWIPCVMHGASAPREDGGPQQGPAASLCGAATLFRAAASCSHAASACRYGKGVCLGVGLWAWCWDGACEPLGVSGKMGRRAHRRPFLQRGTPVMGPARAIRASPGRGPRSACAATARGTRRGGRGGDRPGFARGGDRAAGRKSSRTAPPAGGRADRRPPERAAVPHDGAPIP